MQYYGQDGSFMAQTSDIHRALPPLRQGDGATGDYDLVCNGHEHRAVIERIATSKAERRCESIRGRSQGWPPATYVLGDLETLEFETRPVPL